MSENLTSLVAIQGFDKSSGIGVFAKIPESRSNDQMGFGDILNRGLNGLNQKMLSSQSELQKLSLGEPQNLHQVMINLEETRISFQLMMQVRNKCLEAYQDIMKMQM
jgi:flagellar hook-basal body complex protein FliE